MSSTEKDRKVGGEGRDVKALFDLGALDYLLQKKEPNQNELINTWRGEQSSRINEGPSGCAKYKIANGLLYFAEVLVLPPCSTCTKHEAVALLLWYIYIHICMIYGGMYCCVCLVIFFVCDAGTRRTTHTSHTWGGSRWYYYYRNIGIVYAVLL